MRYLAICFCLIVTGCGEQTSLQPMQRAYTPEPPAQTRGDPDSQPAVRGEAAADAPAKAHASDVPDIGTRKAGSDWPGFLGPAGTGVSTEKGIVAPWPPEGLRIVWQKPVNTGYSGPSISRGRLFQFDRYGNTACLTCMKSETGDGLWKFEYPTDYEDSFNYNNGPRCCPVVDGDRVYILGAEGMLHCVRVSDGKLVWKADTRAAFGVVQNFFGVGSTPVVDGDLLILQVGGSLQDSAAKDSPSYPSLTLKGNGTGVVAFDKHTGKVRYHVTDELASYASPVLATINGRRWCFVLARGGLIGMEPSTGKIDFHYPWRARILESANASNPVVVGDRVFISETYGPGSALLKVKPGACEEVWTDRDKRFDKSMQCHWNTPIYHDGYLYGCSGRHDNNAELRCIELATGKVMWSQPDLNRTSLLMVDGHFLCLSEDGTLLLLKVNPRKYAEVSRWGLRADQALRPPCWAAALVSHGLLYIRGQNKLMCLELIRQ